MRQGRAQIRIQTTKTQQWRVLNRACAHSTAASADVVSPRRHRHSRYMLCIIPIMYVLWSSAMEGQVPSSLPLGVCICPRITSCGRTPLANKALWRDFLHSVGWPPSWTTYCCWGWIAGRVVYSVRCRPDQPGPSAARDHAAPAHLRNCLSPPRPACVGFVLFWGRPKRGVEDPSTRGVLGSPNRAPDDSLPRSCHGAPSILLQRHPEASYFGYVSDSPATAAPNLGGEGIEPFGTGCRNATVDAFAPATCHIPNTTSAANMSRRHLLHPCHDRHVFSSGT